MVRELGAFANIRLMPDVSSEVMMELKHKAQMHVIHSENPSGFKIKLLNALFSARHVIVNDAIVSGEHLNDVTHSFRNTEELRTLLRKLWQKPVTRQDIDLRTSVLLPRFSSTENARNLINLIFP